MPKDWKDLEKLVQIIEQSIDLGATVEHDVQMPILSSQSGATAQCDIVIKKGQPPRQTITIVEVQNRNSQVAINDFRGWKQKCEDVGAQHLICVSKQPFSSTIKEQAALSGNTVMLINIQKVLPETLPLGFINMTYGYKNFDITAIISSQMSVSLEANQGLSEEELEVLNTRHGAQEVNLNNPVFSVDGVNRTTLYKLLRDFSDISQGEEVCQIQGRATVAFHPNENTPCPVYYHLENHCLRVGLECEFDWTYEVENVPVSMLSYEQIEGGTLAWIAEVTHNTPRGIVELKVPLIPMGDAGYAIPSMYLDLPEDMTLTMGVKSRTN